ncbi:MAG: efflux RND transporter periplasmic adaptor subunit [Chloroflexi bacterium]|nr:efflux RND transporter periplasmic adaptor subunit [Chloroflexota bacterium]
MTKKLCRFARVALAAALASLLLLCGCRPGAATPPPPKTAPPLEVKAVRPFRGEITRGVTLPGEIKPYQQATLYAKVTGYLKTITVDKGDPVKEGALLAEIEVPELLADSAKYQAELAVAEIDYRRVSEAQKKAPDLVVPLSVDMAKGKYEVAKANLERAETLLTFTKIVAPFSGVITRRMVDAGAFIPAATAGSPQNAALVTLADFSTVRVQVAVPELEASLVAKDQPVKVSVDGIPGRSFDGKVTRFAYALDEASKTMLAEIELPNPKLELRPGMYAIVRIGLERKENALLLPVEALATEKANAFVFAVLNNKAKKVPVKTGFNDGTNVEVLSGIKPEEPVILLSKRAVNDGLAVNVTEIK